MKSAALSLACAALLLAVGCNRSRVDPNGARVLSGNIEVVDAQLGFKIAGRIAQRPVFEGDPVKVGQLVAQLDDIEQKQQLALRRAELAAAEAALAELEAGSRPQEIAAAAAALRSAEAERDRARVDFKRQQELLQQAAISTREHDTAEAQLKVAEARVVEAGEKLQLVREGPRAEVIQQARARVAQARAAVALAETQVDNTRLVSPLTGVVLSHHLEPGEFVSPGTPVVTVADTVHVWVRAYLDQSDLGRLRRGQKVAVTTDSFPGKSYEGIVGFIASEAEFTPKTVQTTKERVKLVFRVKVDINNPNDELKPGMPADVHIPEAGGQKPEA
ncbi:HlyD family efflux transporter periplasmic adaptor subunit [Opitutus sp. ER46]|uniref:HlyD family efflux transporter periplasmic adaptor subunit n=1 Tax=Opitutus sp. ER46 TaxID=2161864 RepID=UPI000D2FE1E4|nr:HlyD family efflux transporter periplasmic adaptor subunit [Opitutus sp. ER46]PTX91453.1 hemolysin secretion protein D [Opitutus sp. ER46]